ncbi:hypothetical protein Droror1_Dr00010826 [Drosera rotundifolia]
MCDSHAAQQKGEQQTVSLMASKKQAETEPRIEPWFLGYRLWVYHCQAKQTLASIPFHAQSKTESPRLPQSPNPKSRSNLSYQTKLRNPINTSGQIASGRKTKKKISEKVWKKEAFNSDKIFRSNPIKPLTATKQTN